MGDCRFFMIVFVCNGTEKILIVMILQVCYSKNIKRNNRPQGGLTEIMSSKTTPSLAKVRGGFSMYGYLQNVKTNVSNAKRNRPKVMISLKSK